MRMYFMSGTRRKIAKRKQDTSPRVFDDEFRLTVCQPDWHQQLGLAARLTDKSRRLALDLQPPGAVNAIPAILLWLDLAADHCPEVQALRELFGGHADLPAQNALLAGGRVGEVLHLDAIH